MDFQLGPEQVDLPPEAPVHRAGHDAHLHETPPLPGRASIWDVHRQMAAARGWLADALAAEYGGGERDPFRIVDLQEELELVGRTLFGLLRESSGRTVSAAQPARPSKRQT
jgi:alkylation response protein AidB-like acyl-CoA dehydrogenase